VAAGIVLAVRGASGAAAIASFGATSTEVFVCKDCWTLSCLAASTPPEWLGCDLTVAGIVDRIGADDMSLGFVVIDAIRRVQKFIIGSPLQENYR
jgi:hypothetical protein